MIKFLFMDVDGTLTDGKIYMGNTGEIIKVFDIKDGAGICDILIPSGIVPVIITARTSQILVNRCKELNITQLYQGCKNKIEKLDEILAYFSEKYHKNKKLSKDDFYNYSNVAYIGDDIIDLMCMIPVKNGGGIIGCPSNAVKQVLDIADFISSRNGGDGAVREFIEWIIEKQRNEL